MKRVALCAILLMSFSSAAMAGQVYGTLFQDNHPLAGVPVRLTCGSESTDGATDGQGTYRLFVRATGNCTLTLEPNGRRAGGTLYSYDRPTAYDFDVINQGGRWFLGLRKR